MRVRIRFGKRPQVSKKRRRNQRVALGLAVLLSPAAFLVAVVGMWRIASDMNLAGNFAISSGFFSHWQVWLVAAGILQVCARLLNRYGKRGERATRS
jgi:hypothetical protein